MPYKDSQKQRAAQATWYRDHKARLVARTKAARQERQAVVDIYKLERGCSRCPYRKCAKAIDAHHRDPVTKNFSIARGILDCKSIDLIMAELEKCDLMCANCHRELHDEAGTIGMSITQLADIV